MVRILLLQVNDNYQNLLCRYKLMERLNDEKNELALLFIDILIHRNLKILKYPCQGCSAFL